MGRLAKAFKAELVRAGYSFLSKAEVKEKDLANGGVDCEFKFSQEVPAGLKFCLKFYTLDMGEFQGHKEFSEEALSQGITVDRIDLDDRQ